MVLLDESVNTVLINTGNLLSLSDITRRPGQNPTEELCEAIRIAVGEPLGREVRGDSLLVRRRHDDLDDKMAAHDRADLKVGIKLFASSDSDDVLRDAVASVLTALKIESIESLILAYSHRGAEEQRLQRLKKLWQALEELVHAGKILQIGLSDLEEGAFRAVHEWSGVKPGIVQINLATCCVVPASLQAFCKENEVQLLTHSDPSDLLPGAALGDIFDQRLRLNWALRFQVHVKCRGVLATKGYLVSLCRERQY